MGLVKIGTGSPPGATEHKGKVAKVTKVTKVTKI